MIQNAQKIAQSRTDCDVPYFVVGEGQPLVLIHAGGLNQDMWLPQVESLKRDYKLITFDIKGHGSTVEQEQPGFEIDDVLAILQTEKLEKVNLIGLSLGAAIALDFALHYPEMVEKLVLASPGLYGFQDENPEYLKLMEAIVQAISAKNQMAILWTLKKVNAIGTRKELPDERLDEYVERHLANYISNGGLHKVPKLKNTNPVGNLKDLPHETLILYGLLDFDYVRENAEKLKEELSNASLKSIDEAAHLINLENQRVFNQLIREFVG